MKHVVNRLYHMTIWMTAVVMICTAAFSGAAAAETAGGEAAVQAEVDPSALLDRVLELRGNIADVPLENDESVDAFCRMLYDAAAPDSEKVYYGDAAKAKGLMLSLHAALFPDEEYTDTSLFIADYYYVYLWAILHFYAANGMTAARPEINEMMKELFQTGTSDIFIEPTNIWFEYIGQYEPELVDGGYTMNLQSASINGSDEYVRAYREGVQLFNEGKYPEAIEAYTRAVRCDETETLAHMEIAEAYIAMHDFEKAREWLHKVIPNIRNDSEKARVLRRLGFIAIEEGKYEAGAAFYTCSRKYEDSELATNDLAYIMHIAPDTKQFTMEEAIQYVSAEFGISFEE